jgi:acetyl esterase
LPVGEARAASQGMAALGHPLESVASVEERTVPGGAHPIPVRVYRPTLDERLPALMFFHGGGMVLCDLESHDRECRALANRSGAVVIAVDYRRAPEHPFPAAPEDAYAATKYVAEHAHEFGIDPGRLAVGGDSAGATLATVVALMADERGGPALKFQLLVYPLVDYMDESPSMAEYGADHFLTRGVMDWFANLYVPRAEDRRHPYASPLLATNVQRLPPAFVITAECDPLRDQGEAYARRLQAAGVPVRMKRYPGMIHPFFSLGGMVDEGRQAVGEAALAVREALGG